MDHERHPLKDGLIWAFNARMTNLQTRVGTLEGKVAHMAHDAVLYQVVALENHHQQRLVKEAHQAHYTAKTGCAI